MRQDPVPLRTLISRVAAWIPDSTPRCLQSPDLRAFAALTLGASLLIGLPVAAASHELIPVALPTDLMGLVVVSPALAAVWLTRQQGTVSGIRGLVRHDRGSGRLRWIAVAVALPFAINVAALAIHAITGGTTPDLPGTPTPDQRVAPVLLLPVALLLLSAAEEIGWRRYALPRLQNDVSALAASLALGTVWFLWHVPLGLMAGTTQASLHQGWYFLGTLATTILFTWLYNSSGGSLTTVVLLHASIQASNIVVPTLPANAGTSRVHALTVGVTVLVAAAVVGAHGPRHLAAMPRQLALGSLLRAVDPPRRTLGTPSHPAQGLTE